MPFLIRGKARSRINRPKIVNSALIPVTQNVSDKDVVTEVAKEVKVEVTASVNIEKKEEEQKVLYQEVTYRVPKEERLLDLPLEEEVEEILEQTNNIIPEENEGLSPATSIGAVLKKKKRDMR